MTGDPPPFWNNDDISRLLAADSSQLKDMAACLGIEPSRLFKRADFRGVDLRGQDLRGLDLREANLVGAIIDESTMIDDYLSAVGFAAEKEVLENIEPRLLPLIGRRDTVLQVISAILDGTRIVSLVGREGVGKSGILNEIRSVLAKHRSINFALPSSLRDYLQGHPPFTFLINARKRSIAESLLLRLGDPGIPLTHKRLILQAAEDHELLRRYSAQLDLFGRKPNLIKKIRKSPIRHQEEFLTILFQRLHSLRPDIRVIFTIDDIELMRSPHEVAWLAREIPQSQIIMAGRYSEGVDQHLNAGEIITRLSQVVEPLASGAMKQIFDWVEGQTRGAIRIPGPARDQFMEWLGTVPPVIISAVRLTAAFMVAERKPLPLLLSGESLLKSANEIYDRLLAIGGITAPLFRNQAEIMIQVVGLENRLVSAGGVSESEIAETLELVKPDSSVFVTNLVKRHSLFPTGSARYRGSLVEVLQKIPPRRS